MHSRFRVSVAPVCLPRVLRQAGTHPEEPSPVSSQSMDRRRVRQLLMKPAPFVVTELLRFKHDCEFRERSGEAERHFIGILLQHRCSRILSNINGFSRGIASAKGSDLTVQVIGSETLRWFPLI